VENFFVRVLTAVLDNPQIQAMLKQLFADALDVATEEIKTELGKLEAGVVESIEALPGEILGDATKDVGVLLREITGTKDDIAGAVKGEVQPLLPTVDSLQSMLANALRNLPGGGFIGGILGK